MNPYRILAIYPAAGDYPFNIDFTTPTEILSLVKFSTTEEWQLMKFGWEAREWQYKVQRPWWNRLRRDPSLLCFLKQYPIQFTEKQLGKLAVFSLQGDLGARAVLKIVEPHQ